MKNNSNKLGAFIVPTGIGASIGGYAGDASPYARKISEVAKLIVNPNVVNAGGFSGINDNMLYVEGYSLDEFFKGNLNLLPAKNNKIGIVYDKAIPKDVLNIHFNTQNAVAAVYGIDIRAYEVTKEEVGVEFYITNEGISTGLVRNIETIGEACKLLIDKGCEAIAIVCLFDEAEDDNPDYANGQGVDPVGGVEAIISHYVSKHFKIPCAHSPAFKNYEISTHSVNPKSASEYITPTFLPCILLGLSDAPNLVNNDGFSVKDLDFLIMPYNSLGSTPVFEALKNGIPVYAVKENSTELDITKESLFKNSPVIEVQTYNDVYKLLAKS